MRFRPGLRTIVCQALALLGYLLFLGYVNRAVPPQICRQAVVAPKATVFIAVADKEPKRSKREIADKAKVQPQPKPSRKPERFRVAAARNKDQATAPELPERASRSSRVSEKIRVPQRDLPLSYLMKFRNMEEFHAFLDCLPETDDADRASMSLIRIEGLPETVPDMRRLFDSYRMQPFLFNPARFNYLITHDFQLLRNPDAIRAHVAGLGRYLREDGENTVWRAICAEFIAGARRNDNISSAITDTSEFDRMSIGLASPQLTRFFRKLEADTARQLSDLMGKPVSTRDIARIDCRFRDVNGAMVLVPWQANLGTTPGSRAIRIWKDG